MLKYPVYVQNITNLSDARYCAGMGVEYLGFCFDENNGITYEQYHAIKGWISGVKFVAEFTESSLEHIQKTVALICPDFVLIDSKNITWQYQINAPVIFKFAVDNSLHHFAPAGAMVLLNTKNQSQTLAQSSQLLKEFVFDYSYKLFLSYGFDAQNIDETFAKYLPYGIALSGESEIETGLKNFDHLSEILEIIEI